MNLICNKKILAFVVMGMMVFFGTKNTAFAVIASSTELFHLNIGTATTTDVSSVGYFTDERTAPLIKKFSFPASFAVDTTSNIVMILDTVRNRVALFSMSGQYKGEIKLPFKFQPTDFSWFPRTKTMVFVFQGKLMVGSIQVDLSSGFSVRSPLLFDISKVPTLGGASTTILNIVPIDLSNNSQNHFMLSLVGATSSSEFIQTAKGLRGVSASAKKISDSFLRKIPIGAGAIEATIGTNTLGGVQNIGSDNAGNVYVAASYVSDTIESSGQVVVYKISPTGTLTSGTEVFPSPKMVTNRSIFVDPQGFLFYMKADDPKTIGFYAFNGAQASSTVVSKIAVPQSSPGFISLFCSVSDTGNLSSIIDLIIAFAVIIVIGLAIILFLKRHNKVSVIICGAVIAVFLIGSVCFVTVARYMDANLCGTLLTFDDLVIKGGNTDDVGFDMEMPSPYAGLMWQNVWVQDSSTSKIKSGYKNGTISQKNALYNPYGNDSYIRRNHGLFNLVSVYMGSAWKKDVRLDIKGYLAGKLLYTNTFTLNPDLATYIQIDHSLVDEVVFQTSGGTEDARFVDPYSNSHAQFVMDNLRVRLR